MSTVVAQGVDSLVGFVDNHMVVDKHRLLVLVVVVLFLKLILVKPE
jgi:hypothetical protein